MNGAPLNHVSCLFTRARERSAGHSEGMRCGSSYMAASTACAGVLRARIRKGRVAHRLLDCDATRCGGSLRVIRLDVNRSFAVVACLEDGRPSGAHALI
jgi:hypothetical protein